jgi:Zn-dependent protease with chaperone function
MTAVLAHELGHFAQRSMAVGRWVYIAQQVAGQIVASRSWLDRALSALSSVDLRVAWIGWVMRIIVWSIRSLLDTTFGLVILAQRALGREMEFQADLVSVSLTGSDALVHALHRLGAADGAWSNALSITAREASAGHAVPDVFALQTRIIERMAGILNEPKHGASPELPARGRQEHRVFEQQLAEPPRMWSTHPANRDREDNATTRSASTSTLRSMLAPPSACSRIRRSCAGPPRRACSQKRRVTRSSSS